MPNTREMELWRLVNKAFQNSIEKFGDIFAKDVTRDLLDNGVTVQEWISVKERLPEENVRVLVRFRFTDYSQIEMDTDRIEKGRWYRWSKYVTHWMPLPSTEGLE